MHLFSCVSNSSIKEIERNIIPCLVRENLACQMQSMVKEVIPYWSEKEAFFSS